MRPLLYLCICFVTTKMIVGVENVCIAEYMSVYPYNRSYLQVRSTLVKQRVCALTQSCKSTIILMMLTY